MRALVPLGEKSSESVPERVLPYRHLLERYTSVNQNLNAKNSSYSKRCFVNIFRIAAVNKFIIFPAL